MKKQYSLFVFAALLIGGVLFHSCQKDEIQYKEKLQEGIDHAGYLLNTTDGGDCNTDCIDLEADPVMYFPKTDQETVQWGGPQGTNNTKVIDLEYYNTETHFIIRYKSTHSPANLVIDDEDVLEYNGPEDTWVAYEIELEYGWAACDPIHYDVRVEGSGPPADFDLEYALIGICVDCVIRHETAWADGPRYVEQGNWATYTVFVEDGIVNIYAGQTELIGTVAMSIAEALDGEGNPTGEFFQDLVFELVDGWVLKDVDENVKIEGYIDVPPAQNPAPGQFTYKESLGGITSWGIGFSSEVHYNYFGIHLDVEICE